jgi:GNAT superfamily N-acetyltransferase
MPLPAPSKRSARGTAPANSTAIPISSPAVAVTAEDVWSAYARVGRSVYAGGEAGEAHGGDGWFALLSREANCELNVCGLTPAATPASAAALLAAIGDDELPAIVSVASSAAPSITRLLDAAGFVPGPLAEPLMWCTAPPEPGGASFRVARASDEAALAAGLALAAEAHGVELGMVERSLGRTARAGDAVDPWIAWDGDEPVSVVFLTSGARRIGVWSMMTAARHRRRGAGRAVLAGALAAAWQPATEGAFLWATPAGRHLYASCGFAVLDESRGYARGADAALLEALGQAPRS